MIKSYDIIYADPPWNQRKGGKKSARPNSSGSALDYPVLGLGEIKDILARYDGKILFLWTIDKYLFEAQKIAESLSYKLHARLIWDKVTGIPVSFDIRFSHEYLLWMYKTPMLPIAKDMRGKLRTVFTEKVTKHSRKPVIAYEMIEKLYPNTTRIELFARQRRSGWDSWGNQLPSTVQEVLHEEDMTGEGMHLQETEAGR